MPGEFFSCESARHFGVFAFSSVYKSNMSSASEAERTNASSADGTSLITPQLISMMCLIAPRGLSSLDVIHNRQPVMDFDQIYLKNDSKLHCLLKICWEDLLRLRCLTYSIYNQVQLCLIKERPNTATAGDTPTYADGVIQKLRSYWDSFFVKDPTVTIFKVVLILHIAHSVDPFNMCGTVLF